MLNTIDMLNTISSWFSYQTSLNPDLSWVPVSYIQPLLRCLNLPQTTHHHALKRCPSSWVTPPLLCDISAVQGSVLMNGNKNHSGVPQSRTDSELWLLSLVCSEITALRDLADADLREELWLFFLLYLCPLRGLHLPRWEMGRNNYASCLHYDRLEMWKQGWRGSSEWRLSSVIFPQMLCCVPRIQTKLTHVALNPGALIFQKHTSFLHF